MTTRAQAIAAAAECLAEGIAARDSLPPEEAAWMAWTPTCPYTVEELAEQIRVRRAAARRAAS